MTAALLLLAAGTLADSLTDTPRFERLVREAGLLEALRAPGHYTVLVPPDELLAKFEGSRAELLGLVANHIVDGAILKEGARYTLHGETLASKDVEGARGTGAARACSNGLIVPVNRLFAPAAIREGDRLAAGDSFRIRIDAPLPVGWPRPGPLEDVRLKAYPPYRLAVDPRGNFGTLFRHIQKNEIAMTAPVEMGMDEDLQLGSMAFLYRHPEQGEKGREGRVEVRDVASRFALSVGIRGVRSQEKADEAVRALRADLAKREGWREVENGLAVFGFNSPFILPSDRYWEVVLVIEPARKRNQVQKTNG